MAEEFVLDLQKVFDDYIEANPKEWMYDRGESVGASEVYGCLREAWFKKRGKDFGFEQDADFTQRWGATERGNVIENNFVVPAVSNHLPEGLELLYQGENQTTLVDGRASATPDGLIRGLPWGAAVVVKYRKHIIRIPDIKSDCINLEVKSIDPFTNINDEKQKHNYQTHMQVGLIREKTQWKPVFSIILYINASWLDEITPFVIEFDEDIYAIGKGRAEDVFEVTNPNDIIPEGRMDGSCDYCAFKVACGTTILDNMPEADSEGDVHDEDVLDFSTYVSDYKAAQASKADNERAMKIAQERIKEILTENRVRKAPLPNDGGSVSWSQVKGKKTLDKDAMEEDGIDLEKYMKTGQPYDRLNINVKKAKQSKVKSKNEK